MLELINVERSKMIVLQRSRHSEAQIKKYKEAIPWSLPGRID
jgi:hypothetical protein